MVINKSEFRIEYGEKQAIEDRTDRELLESYQCDFLLLIQEKNQETEVLFISGSNRIRAVEFLDYVMSEFGLIKGNANRAEGVISTTILNTEMVEKEVTESKDYFALAVEDYLEHTVCIVANEYGTKYEQEIKELPRYQKKKLNWAFVRSTDVAPEGEQIYMKTLENESGITVISHKDLYIMIGCRGEVYEIGRQKFENTYQETIQELDIFGQMLEFIPEVQNLSTGEYVTIDEMAKLCYPKQTVPIYIQQLKQRTKVFKGDGTGDYFLGRTGDYMAVRTDDIRDIYVIKQDVFGLTYEKVAND